MEFGEPNAEQQAALDGITAAAEAGDRCVAALVGAAGTGKTFTTRMLLDALEARCPDRPVVLTAPTHPAVAVLMEAAGRSATTLHSLLALKPPSDDDRGAVPIGTRRHKIPRRGIVVCDEASMVGLDFLSVLMERALEQGAFVVLIGDAAQLPPVGETEPRFADVAEADAGAWRLTRIMRQRDGSLLPEAAAPYRDASIPFALPTASWMASAGGMLVRPWDEGLAEFLDRISDPVETADVAFAVYTNASVAYVNRLARGALHGDVAADEPFLPGETVVANESIMAGERVLVANNQMCLVQEVRPPSGRTPLPSQRLLRLRPLGGGADVSVMAADWTERDALMRSLADEARALTARLDDLLRDAGLESAWRTVRARDNSARSFARFLDERGGTHAMAETDVQRRAAWRRSFALRAQVPDIRPAYCSTVHKLQGRTVDDVYIGARGFEGREDGRRLMYVAMTRARRTAHVLV